MQLWLTFTCFHQSLDLLCRSPALESVVWTCLIGQTRTSIAGSSRTFLHAKMNTGRTAMKGILCLHRSPSPTSPASTKTSRAVRTSPLAARQNSKSLRPPIERLPYSQRRRANRPTAPASWPQPQPCVAWSAG